MGGFVGGRIDYALAWAEVTQGRQQYMYLRNRSELSSVKLLQIEFIYEEIMSAKRQCR
jgi:hypothetical protein